VNWKICSSSDLAEIFCGFDSNRFWLSSARTLCGSAFAASVAGSNLISDSPARPFILDSLSGSVMIHDTTKDIIGYVYIKC